MTPLSSRVVCLASGGTGIIILAVFNNLFESRVIASLGVIVLFNVLFYYIIRVLFQKRISVFGKGSVRHRPRC